MPMSERLFAPNPNQKPPHELRRIPPPTPSLPRRHVRVASPPAREQRQPRPLPRRLSHSPRGRLRGTILSHPARQGRPSGAFGGAIRPDPDDRLRRRARLVVALSSVLLAL